MDYIPMTENGFSDLKQELDRLKYTEMPKVIEMISEARKQGDLSENAEYTSAKSKQAFLNSKIKTLQNTLLNAKIIDINSISDKSCIRFSATVEIVDLMTDKIIKYTILNDFELSRAENVISALSPLGRALLGKKVGDIIDFHTSNDVKSYEVKSIQYLI